LVLLVAGTMAQQFASSSWNAKEHEVSFVVGAPKSGPVVMGAPYSADDVQGYTAPDGTAGARSTVIGHYARDGQGSTPNLPFALQSHFGQGVMPKPIHCNMGLRKTAE